MRQAVHDIIASLQTEPHRWRLAYCTWSRSDGIEVWRANVPVLNISLYKPQTMYFSLRERFALWKAFRKWEYDMPLDGYKP